MCFFRFFNALSCTGKHATSVMFYKVKMTFFFFFFFFFSPRLDFFLFHIKLDRARGVRL